VKQEQNISSANNLSWCGRFCHYLLLRHIDVFWSCNGVLVWSGPPYISKAVWDMTLTILWKNHQKTQKSMPWKYFCSRSAFFSFHIFGWPFLVKSWILKAGELIGNASRHPCCEIKNPHLYDHYWPCNIGREEKIYPP